METLAMSEFLSLLASSNPGLAPPIDETNCNISDCGVDVPGNIDRNTSVRLVGTGYPFKNRTVVYYNRHDYGSIGVIDFPFESQMTKQQFLDRVSVATGVNFNTAYIEDFTMPSDMTKDFVINIKAKGVSGKNYYCVGEMFVRGLYRPDISQAFTALRFNGL